MRLRISISLLGSYIALHCKAGRTRGTGDILAYRKVASSNMSGLEAHAGFFRLLMKGIFGPYVL